MVIRKGCNSANVPGEVDISAVFIDSDGQSLVLMYGDRTIVAVDRNSIIVEVCVFDGNGATVRGDAHVTVYAALSNGDRPAISRDGGV
eukprot:IDg8265t1